ncbi:MAG TPA: nuclear transport factor 2 family protein [Chryseolinea sp.]|nr:nuclear transport factor 2 family protein [Chryseolinea sp.]
MKKTFLFFPVLLIFFFTSNAQTADEVKILAGVETLHKGLIERSKPILDSISARELTYGHSAGMIDDKTSFINRTINGPVKFNSIKPSNLSVSLAGNNAIVRYIFSASATNEGKPAELKFGVMMVWQKTNDQWKLLARQGYKL